MKVCIITDAWPPQVNGVVTTMRNMVAGLEAKGHEVLVIHPALFNCFPCPTYPEIRIAFKPYAKLTRLVNEFGPQAIHITAEGTLGLAGRRYCLRNKLSFTSSVCTRYPEYVQMRFGLPASWLYRFLRWFHAPATHTMVAAPSLLEELEEMGFRGLTYWEGAWTSSFSGPARRSFSPCRGPSACTWVGWRLRKTWRPSYPWICPAPKW